MTDPIRAYVSTALEQIYKERNSLVLLTMEATGLGPNDLELVETYTAGGVSIKCRPRTDDEPPLVPASVDLRVNLLERLKELYDDGCLDFLRHHHKGFL